MTLTLYSSWRASAPYRVRIGLALKGLAYAYVSVDVAADAQREPDYRAVNPQALVPTLVLPDGRRLSQSMAILEWLDETHPAPPLLPADPTDRAVVRAMSGVIACDIHPVNNRRILQAIMAHGVDADGAIAWQQRWMSDGFDALEPLIAEHGRGYAFGDRPSLVDCCLVPQAYNARRVDLTLERWPALAAAIGAAMAHPAFIAARPDNQPDAR
jgi:maleylacetoacetate isomerase/maleylpyruvate isomerase